MKNYVASELNSQARATSDESFRATLERARRGDNAAFEAIFEEYKGLVRAKSRSYFLVGADSEDLIQEGMIGLYKAIRDYNPEKNDSFKAFAEMCVTRQIITAIYKATRLKHRPLNFYISLSKSAPGDDSEHIIDNVYIQASVKNPEELLIDRENNISFRNDLKTLLSNLEISALSLHLKGASYAEISKKIGKPVKSIDNALQRVKRKLEKYLV